MLDSCAASSCLFSPGFHIQSHKEKKQEKISLHVKILLQLMPAGLHQGMMFHHGQEASTLVGAGALDQRIFHFGRRCRLMLSPQAPTPACTPCLSLPDRCCQQLPPFPYALPQRKPHTPARAAKAPAGLREPVHSPARSSIPAPAAPRAAEPRFPARPTTRGAALDFPHHQQLDGRRSSSLAAGAAKRKFNYSFPDRAAAPAQSEKSGRTRSGHINEGGH